MLMQFLFGPFIGNLSDRFGRRPVLLVSLFVLGIDYLILGFANTIWLLLVGRFLAGIAGATYGTAYAVVADVSTKENKARNFGFVGAGFGIGFILGPSIGTLLVELDLGMRAPIFGAAILSFVNFAFGYVAFKETLSKDKRRPFEWKRANPLGAFLVLGQVPGAHRWLAAAFLSASPLRSIPCCGPITGALWRDGMRGVWAFLWLLWGRPLRWCKSSCLGQWSIGLGPWAS